uniref:Uncharacterized protein n=1 Tax=viral metagenome TaxID=1070528 RepID=A0A6C0K9K3_9ZZZZ
MDPNLQSWKDGGEEQDSLLKCLKQVGRMPMLINNRNWTLEALFIAMQISRKSNLKKRDWEQYVFVFDPMKVGFGEYGAERPVSMISRKWDGSLGLIQFRRDGMIFKPTDEHEMEDFILTVACIPKQMEYEKHILPHFLQDTAICNRCTKVSEPFEVLENGKTYCLGCVNKIYPEFCNICNNRHTGENVMIIQMDGPVYTCRACRKFMSQFIP